LTTAAPPLSATGTGIRAGIRRRPEATLIVSGAVSSVANYGYTLAVLWLLPAREYAIFGSVASLLLLCGTISSASTPWVVAREVARSAPGSDRRAAAVSFGLVSVSLQGIAAGLATAVVASHYSSDATVIVVLGASVAIFIEAAGIGYLQGLERFSLIAVLRVLEVVAKIGAGVALIELRGGATGAVAGFLVGATLVTVIVVCLMRPDIRRAPGALRNRALWSSARGLLAIQSGVAVLAGMDIVLASLTVANRTSLATYQAAQILGRIPVFVGTALSLVLFARLAKAADGDAQRSQGVLALFVTVCVPVAMCVGTLPGPISGLLFPAGYGDVRRVLPLVAAGGLAVGFVNLLTTVFQALHRFTPAIIVVWSGVALGLPVEYWGIHRDGIIGLAWAVIGVGTVVAVVLACVWQQIWGLSATRLALTGLALGALALPLVVLRRSAPGWAAYVVLVVGPVVAVALWRFGARVRGSDPDRLTILHLGFEDPAQPGAGGGSARTHEINRRIALDVDITVVCAAYPGCRARTVDGVRYEHVGIARSGNLGRMSYFACVPYALWRYRSDLVVEDFGAPISSVGVPWMTSRPVIGMVQWLFAAEKARQYHLPFGLVERIGLHSHRTLVTVSDDLGAELRRRNPRASVTVIENGLAEDAFVRVAGQRADIAFLGRLEIAQKGLDLLLQAFSLVAPHVRQRLVIAGDGPDGDRLGRMAGELGIAERVDFVGRLAVAERAKWLAGMDLVVVPSRYETFGLVAAEALAAGTPVVAFDIPCLRGLVTTDVGVVVPPFDVVALAKAITDLVGDDERRLALGRAGPGAVAGLKWDELASAQLQLYRSALRTSAT
jgi:glycosyltransferase involved in cell wall biosynthesis/O-antigen/teichoic acid export membrane protein